MATVLLKTFATATLVYCLAAVIWLLYMYFKRR